ncbi:MAG: transglutaminase-like domain-containing protein [Bacteroidota bacterium]
MNSESEKVITEIKSLIKLLDDDDEQIYKTARDRLLEHGDIALPYLFQQHQIGSIAAKRITGVREVLLRSYFKNEIRTLKKTVDGDVDLEEGVFLIARTRYFDCNTVPYINQLNTYAYQLKEKLISVVDPTELFHRIISYFVEEVGFTGNQTDYYSEDNHYINRVLETKTGIPITLSVVYLLVGKRINLPLSGIGLPGHFILRLSLENTNIYFDPYNNGKILTRRDCETIVSDLGFTFTDDYLRPVTNRQILERMFRNIILSLERKQDTERIETIRQFIDTLNSDL